MSRKFKLKKSSQSVLSKWLKGVDIDSEEEKEKFSVEFSNIVVNDCKMIKDCTEEDIVNFYISAADNMIKDHKLIDDNFYNDLKTTVRTQLADKYVSKDIFDNSIDIYFNDVKREYIMHPQNESEDMLFVPENRDIFVKNNLKLVIECAKRYRNLGVPFEDLIQIGNVGLLTAFDKFDTKRSNLKYNILEDIKNQDKECFTKEEATSLIQRNFSYSKLLDATLKKLPVKGFNTKEEFYNWADKNIKKASFSSISFFWIRALIILELNNFSSIVKGPKSSKDGLASPVTIVHLDSINPYTNDNYSDGEISEVANEEFVIEDESIENMERRNLFKDLVDGLLGKLPLVDSRIVKRRFGIGFPFPSSVNDIAETEGLSVNKVKYSLSNSLKIIAANIPDKDKDMIKEMLM